MALLFGCVIASRAHAAPPAQRLTDEIFDAVRAGDVAAVERWIAAGRTVQLRDREGNRLLHAAIVTEQVAIVRRLLEGGANPEKPSALGWSPLLLACEHGQAAIVAELLDRGAARDAEPRLATTTAGWAASSPRASPSVRWQPYPPALVLAAEGGHADVVRLLLVDGAPMHVRDELGRSSLFHAAMRGHIAVVQELLSRGEPAKVLLELGDDCGWRPIHAAAAHGRLEALELLLAHGVDTAARSHAGYTAAELAARLGEVEIAMLLASHEGPDARPSQVAGSDPDVEEFRRARASAAITGSRGSRRVVRDPPPLLTLTRQLPYRGGNCLDPVWGEFALVFALWPDGEVLFAADPQWPGERLLVGTDTGALREIASLLHEIGATRLGPCWEVDSSARADALVFDVDGTRVDHVTAPGLAMNRDARTERRFAARQVVTAMELARRLLDGLALPAGTPLEDHLVSGRFRGYRADEPRRTTWLRGL